VRSTLGRVEGARSHLSALNRLCLSTRGDARERARCQRRADPLWRRSWLPCRSPCRIPRRPCLVQPRGSRSSVSWAGTP